MFACGVFVSLCMCGVCVCVGRCLCVCVSVCVYLCVHSCSCVGRRMRGVCVHAHMWRGWGGSVLRSVK